MANELKENIIKKNLIKNVSKIDQLKEKNVGNIFTNFIAEYAIIGSAIGTACGFLINNIIVATTTDVISPLINNRVISFIKLFGITNKNQINVFKNLFTQILIFFLVIILIMVLIFSYKKFLNGENNSKKKKEKVANLRAEIDTDNYKSINNTLIKIDDKLDKFDKYFSSLIKLPVSWN